MAAPQIISLGIGAPASIGWFITLGLGFEAPVVQGGNPRNLMIGEGRVYSPGPRLNPGSGRLNI